MDDLGKVSIRSTTPNLATFNLDMDGIGSLFLFAMAFDSSSRVGLVKTCDKLSRYSNFFSPSDSK